VRSLSFLGFAMGKLFDLVRVVTSTTGQGTITLGPAVDGFLTFAEAGVQNGDVVSYGLRTLDGQHAEVGEGTYSSSGPTMTRSVSASTNGGDPIDLDGPAVIFITPRAVDFLLAAVAADFRVGTALNKALTPKAVWDGAEYVSLTDASTIAVDMSAGFNFQVTLGGNRTLGNPTSAKPGQSGVIKINTNGSNRTLAFGSNWKAAGGEAPDISDTDTIDLLFYHVVESDFIVYSLLTDVS